MEIRPSVTTSEEGLETRNIHLEATRKVILLFRTLKFKKCFDGSSIRYDSCARIVNINPFLMKKIVVLLALTFVIISCEKDNNDLLVGKWKIVEGFNIMAGGKYSIPVQEQRIEEYTKHLRVLYDFEGNEVARSNYDATETTITVNGVNEDGKPWSFSYEYVVRHDTLTQKHDGGFESYSDYLVRIK